MASPSNEMAIFQRVAERGSFAGAADDVGLSPSAVAKLISRLEARLGVRLINRTTRRLALTAEGEIYLAHAREILAAIEAAESDVASARLSPRGHLRVHAFPVVAVHHLVPVLPDFLKRYPQITFDFLVTNRIVDILGENVDISLRMGALDDSALVARKIVDLRRIVCASPGYLARHGRPVRPADLAHHSCLTLSRNPGAATWPFRFNGELVQIDVKGTVSADSADMLLGLAIEGAGILRISEHVVAEAIEKGQLEPLLQNVQDPEKYPLWGLLPPGRHQAPKVRAFLDFLIERLGSAPWRADSRPDHDRKRRRARRQPNLR
jgi:DNA-binding transcriptional LysR family regulator